MDEIETADKKGVATQTEDVVTKTNDVAVQTDDVLTTDQPAATHRRRASTDVGDEEPEPTRAESVLAFKLLTDQAQAPGGPKLTVEQVLRQDIWVTKKLKDRIRKTVAKRYGDPKEVRAVKVFIDKKR